MITGDLHGAWRSITRSPKSAVVIVLTLGLGVGANTAVLTLVNHVLWSQLPFRDPGRLVAMWSKRADRDKAPLSIADFEDFRRDQSLEDAAAFGVYDANLGDQAEPERLQGVKSTANIFQLLGVSAAPGRTLAAADDRPGSARTVVLSHSLWERRFGGASDLIGRRLLLNGDPYTVVGILPSDFFFPNPSLSGGSVPLIRDVDFVVPLVPDADPRRADRGDHFLSTLARLKSRVSAGAAEERLSAEARRLQHTYPLTNNKNTGVRLVGLADELVGNFRAELLLIAAAAAVLLLMACTSLANLSLTLAFGRRYELAIRSSMGATRAALVRQLVWESAFKAFLGAAVAIAAAYGGVALLVALGPAGQPRLKTVQVDGYSMIVDLTLALTAGLILGILPALGVARTQLISELRSGSRGATEGRSSMQLRSLLCTAQIASSVVLLVSAGLLLRSFLRLEAVRPGFDPSHVLAVRVALMPPSFPTPGSIAGFQAELRRELEALAGVQSVGAISILPMSGSLALTDFTIEGRPPAAPENTPSANYRVAGPGYFAAMRIPLVEGREFSESDTLGTRRVAIVNQALARRFFAGSAAIGAHLRMQGFGGGELEIVGVAGDVRQAGLSDAPGMDLYLPYAQASVAAAGLLRNNMYSVIRTGREPLNLTAAVRRTIYGMKKDVAIVSTKALDRYPAATIASRRFNLVLLAVFAASAMLLAVLAVYSAVAHRVTRRTREIGLRVALGARPWSVVAMVVGHGLRLIVAGVGAGLAGALLAARFLSNLLYETEALDSVTFTGVAGLLIVAALAASYLPARRAARLDPLAALRQE